MAWRFANLGAGYVVQGSPDLLPESSWSLSGGLEWTPRGSVLVGAELYSNGIEDLIELVQAGHTPAGLVVYSPRNLNAVATRGFELTLRTITAQGAFSAGYAYLDAHSRDSGAPLSRRAKHSGRVRGMWVLASPVGARLDVGVRLVGEAPIIGSDGISKVDARERFVGVDAQVAVGAWEGLELSVGADNLLDARPEGWRSVVRRRLRVGLAVPG